MRHETTAPPFNRAGRAHPDAPAAVFTVSSLDGVPAYARLRKEAPALHLEAATLAPASTGVHRLGRTGFRLPEGGGRLVLPGREPLVLDVWEGNTEGLTLDERRALSVAALMIALVGPTSRA
jgi:hypothetical protein